uniref:Uncharacterized protein n=1 Tax=Malurus cyaneus samueli TaxID=2593467 RepID=A0A8C5TZF1_9PASS
MEQVYSSPVSCGHQGRRDGEPLPELNSFSSPALELHKDAPASRHAAPTRPSLRVMGMVRVPLYTQKDRMGGLPNFLANSFVGTAKFQLLFALKILNMVPEEKLAEAVAATQRPKKSAIDHSGGAAGHLHGHKAGNELAKAGNELGERGEHPGMAHGGAELVGLEGQALAEHLAGAEALEHQVGLGADLGEQGDVME